MMLRSRRGRVDCMDDYHQGYLDDPWTPRIFNLYLMANVASTPDFSPSRLICREESQRENASVKPRLTDMDWSPHGLIEESLLAVKDIKILVDTTTNKHNSIA